ncbi:MAG: hypothetical protein ABJO01_09225 [Parasphingorhabdus sp.]|uniref:hypothetical protein n=1 Tax=Parasphingorhabdus sp. TaxID=2709688 RepID=UPI0032992BF6
MIIRHIIIGFSVLSFSVSPATAKQPNAVLQAIDDALPGRLINDPTVVDWTVYGNSRKPKQVSAPETPGQYAMQLKVIKKGAAKYDMGVNIPIRDAILSGHMITIAFWAKSTKADTGDGNGIVGLRINENQAPYAGFGDQDLKIGTQWKLYEAKMRATMALDAGQAVVGFQLAGAKQTIEIGQVYVLDMGAL